MCELMRRRSAIRSRCSDDVSMLSTVLPASRREMRVGVRALEIAEQHLLREQLLRALQVAVQEHRQAEPQVGDQPRVQVADLGHAGFGEVAALVDLLVLESVRMRSMMSPTCSMLIVNEMMSAQRRLSLSSSASREICVR